MQKRTKIIVTLGPASGTDAIIRQLIEAGTNVFRLNFSHGSHAEYRQRAQQVRAAARQLDTHVALLGDLQGPKIRIRGFAAGPVALAPGQAFVLDAALADDAGSQAGVGVTYPELAQDCHPGQILVLDDGRIELAIERIEQSRVHTRVVTGGLLSAHKGINLRGGGLSAPALTAKDYADIRLAGELNLDYLAISFPRSAEDIDSARQAAESAGCRARLVAKIERSEAVADDLTLDRIIEHADAVMVARGDLGVEIGDAQLIGIQKKIILRARQLNRIVITATQMMESMIDSPIPTRAEVFDVANAVLDGTDAVMLSAETATGKHPVKVVEAMTRIIMGAEKEPLSRTSRHRLNIEFQRIDEAIAMATMYAANHLGQVKAILCLTESGNTPLWMSRIRSGLPIYALSHHEATLNRVTLYRGVAPVAIVPRLSDPADVLHEGMARLKAEGILQTGDLVMCTCGASVGPGGGTNTLKMLYID
jgi:pyruvate kinase